MIRAAILILAGALAGCVMTPAAGPDSDAGSRPGPDGLPSPKVAAANFVSVVDRVEPIAEAICRRERPGVNCDYGIYVAQDISLPPNAAQFTDKQGRPIILFSIGMIATVRNADELAFVLGHEAAHYIESHRERDEAESVKAALTLGIVTALGGGTQREVARAQRLGAAVGARRYSKDHELEADALGARIAYTAGYDPIRGAAYFTRIPDPGEEFLGTHPPNAARIDTVRRVVAQLKAGS